MRAVSVLVSLKLDSPPFLERTLRREGSLSLAGDLHLHNRRDLLDQMPQLPASADDPEIVLAAWQRWGEGALDRLEGCFSLIVWDDRNRILWAATDFIASRTLYFHEGPERLALGSSPQELLRMGVPCRLSLRKFALMGTSLGAAVDDQTLFEGVRAVRAATVLRLDSGGLRLRPYWNAENLGQVRGPRSDSEWIEACREAFDEAVRCRIDGDRPFCVMLSGGLDSSSVAVTASHLTGQPVNAVCSIAPGEESEADDERGYVRMLGGRVRPRLVSSEGRGPFDHVGRLVWLNASPLSSSRHYVYSALAEVAQEGVLLDGILGEFGPSDHARGCLARGLSLGQVLQVLRELLALKRAGEGIKGLVWHELVQPFLPWKFLRRLRRGSQNGLLPLRPDFMRDVLGAELEEAQSWSEQVAHTGPDPTTRVRRLLSLSVGGFSGRFVGDERVRMEYPFLDRRLLDVCLSAPPLLKVRGGLRRFLLRAMMDGRLPDGVRLRRDKHPFSPGYAVHFESQREQVARFLESVPAGGLAHTALDLEAAARIASRPPSGRTDPAALHVLPSIVYSAVFLMNFHRFASDDPGWGWEQPSV